MRTALLLLVAVVRPFLLECATFCKVGNLTGPAEGPCPVELTPVRSRGQHGDTYSECVTVRVWITHDSCKAKPRIEICSTEHKIIRLKMKNCTKPKKNRSEKHVIRDNTETSSPLWELVHDCVQARASDSILVSYTSKTMSCSVKYEVPDPIPDFDLFVNLTSKSITITVQPGEKVFARLCYQKNAMLCSSAQDPPIIIDPSVSRSAQFNIPYLLPCLCVEVYYTHADAKRRKKCPFQEQNNLDVRDVWLSSQLTQFDSTLEWSFKCPTSDLSVEISASLCWRQHEHLCTPMLNATLEKIDNGRILIYNTSSVDKHPQMCVQLSLGGSHNVSCPFQDEIWKVSIELGRQSVFVYLASSVPAMFSTQLCVLSEMGCTPIGPVRELRAEGTTAETKLNMPPHVFAEKPCVQVWQSDPALHGRRILCPGYTHYRWGIYAVAALIFFLTCALLVHCIHHLTKKGAAGWLYIQKPVLLVCSSEQSAHVSAVCALASILQGELSATVHMALWAQSSQRQTRTGVTDLGPLPWLYGQWDVVSKAQGTVLIIWSSEAKKTYEKWKEERATVNKSGGKEEESSTAEMRHEKTKVVVDPKLNGKLRKGKKERAPGKRDHTKLCDEEDWDPQNEPSTVTAPVFTAALGCLEGALQQSKGQGIAIVYFEGLGQSRDIPRALRGVPRYCLPQDFTGTESGTFRWHCWPRLLSKVLFIWLARKLADRLQTLVPQIQATKGKGRLSLQHRKEFQVRHTADLSCPWHQTWNEQDLHKSKSVSVSHYRERRNLNLEFHVSDRDRLCFAGNLIRVQDTGADVPLHGLRVNHSVKAIHYLTASY
ncbi:hypothetical protein Q5P01_007881 [Channa striata]|uniref:Interleukin 17 receptor E n=1 Tax=Channa striata TaxID=64152 RepID=A0AA88SV85_CHASR|nr:hypothetical protein Q5P01_007881 [Channa striata]